MDASKPRMEILSFHYNFDIAIHSGNIRWDSFNLGHFIDFQVCFPMDL